MIRQVVLERIVHQKTTVYVNVPDGVEIRDEDLAHKAYDTDENLEWKLGVFIEEGEKPRSLREMQRSRV